MYNECSFQVRYRRKIFEEIAILAYSGASGNQFKWVPYNVVSSMDACDIANEVSSDLDYVAESCRAALGLEPQNYRDVFFGDPDVSLDSAEHLNPGTQPVLCALKSVCHRCIHLMGEDRPCARACHCGAIHADALGRTVIDRQSCDSCGKCLAACPYGAIIDKSSIFQTIRAIHEGGHVYALLLPGLADQFSNRFTPSELTEAFRLLGFYDTLELERSGNASQPVVRGVNCAGWRSPDSKAHIACCADSIVEYLDAIHEEIDYILSYDPYALFALAVPCAISKIEAAHFKEGLNVSFVLDFEELAGMMDARGLDEAWIRPNELEPLKCFC